jgi:hypothetical protein
MLAFDDEAALGLMLSLGRGLSEAARTLDDVVPSPAHVRLGIMPGGGRKRIEDAFRRLVRRAHPDAGRTGDPTEFHALVEARKRLLSLTTEDNR